MQLSNQQNIMYDKKWYRHWQNHVERLKLNKNKGYISNFTLYSKKNLEFIKLFVLCPLFFVLQNPTICCQNVFEFNLYGKKEVRNDNTCFIDAIYSKKISIIEMNSVIKQNFILREFWKIHAVFEKSRWISV